MTGKNIAMSTAKQIIRLKQGGSSIKEIVRCTKSSKNTVRKYLRLIEVNGYNLEELLLKEDFELEQLFNPTKPEGTIRLEQLEKMYPYIREELKRTGVTRWVLWGEYHKQHPDGFCYTQFCSYLHQWANRQKTSMHFEHLPGEEMYIDYTGKKMSYVDPITGEIIETEIFLAVLGKSQLTYVEATLTQKKEDFIRASENALHFFGGVTKVLITDNLKSAVTKASKYEPELNEDYHDFANHYGAVLVPTRSYKPKDKSLVEKTVSITYSRIFAPLRNKTFYSLEELNQHIRDLNEENNRIPFKGEQYSRQELFESQEKVVLKALPADRYEMKEYLWYTVMINYHVRITKDKNYYSVPHRFVHKKVKVILSQSHVRIFYKGEQIAFHLRSFKNHEYVTIDSHMPENHKCVDKWNPDRFISWAASIDTAVKAYITEIIDRRPYPPQAYRSCMGILSFEKKVGKDRLIAACKRALYHEAYSYKVIDKILSGKLDMLDYEEQTNIQMTIPFHENIRGPENYK
jgi:transposase